MKDSDAIDFDPLYVAATFLDPQYKLLLKPEQLHAVKRMILGIDENINWSNSTDVSSESEEEKVEEAMEPLKTVAS